MFGVSRLFAAGLVLALSAPALAVELNYKWKKGDTHRFSYEDDTTLDLAMAGMAGMPGMPAMGGEAGGGMKMKVQTVFTEKVLATRPDGSADIELTVEKLDFFQGGKKVASIAQVPPAARVVKAEVDRKGRAKFYQMVTVYMREEGMFLGVHKAQVGPQGAQTQASATVGDQQVDVVASIDPKTGKVSAAMKVTERPPALKAVQIKQEDPGVDVLPKQIFEMMVLPEEDLAPGSEARVSMPFGDLRVSLDKLEGGKASLRTRLEGQRVGVDSEPESAAAAQGNTEEGALGGADVKKGAKANMGGMNMGGMNMGGMNMGGMNMGGMNMGGMNMGGAPTGMGAPSGEPISSGVKMDVDATCGFDVRAGRLLALDGTVAMDTDMGASRTRTHSRFTLKRLK